MTEVRAVGFFFLTWKSYFLEDLEAHFSCDKNYLLKMWFSS